MEQLYTLGEHSVVVDFAFIAWHLSTDTMTLAFLSLDPVSYGCQSFEDNCMGLSELVSLTPPALIHVTIYEMDYKMRLPEIEALLTCEVSPSLYTFTWEQHHWPYFCVNMLLRMELDVTAMSLDC